MAIDVVEYIEALNLSYLYTVKHIFKVGDQKEYEHIVTKEDFAAFHGQVVHAVYSTFCITRDAEWSSRLFALEMKDVNEEGIGTFVNIEHLAPAFENEKVVFTATIEVLHQNEIICNILAKVGERLVAKGKTGQKIIDKEKLEKYFNLMKQQI